MCAVWPFKKRSLAVPASSDELLKVVFDTRAALKIAQERLDALEDKHERLRGRVYATGLHKPPIEPQSKGDILREFGYVPGRPAPHK